MEASVFDMDKKKAAWLSISALGSMLVSYLVFKKVSDDAALSKKEAQAELKLQRKRERMLRRAGSWSLTRGSSSAANGDTKIVGANQQFQTRDELTQEEREQLNLERMEKDLRNAATGTKTIYFDSNDNMYTEEEVFSGNIKKKRNLTKMKVRVPEQDRQRLSDVQSRHTQDCLEDFLHQIKQNKHKYVKERQGVKTGKARSSHMRLGMGSDFTTSSNTVRSLNRIKLEPRHFKSKEGTVWLNMFETISNNYCFPGAESGSQQKDLQNRFNPHRYVLPKDQKSCSSKRGYRDLSLDRHGGTDKSRRSRADLKQAQPGSPRPRVTRSTSLNFS